MIWIGIYFCCNTHQKFAWKKEKLELSTMLSKKQKTIDVDQQLRILNKWAKW